MSRPAPLYPADASERDLQANRQRLQPLIASLKPTHAALLHLIELDGTSVSAAAEALDLAPRQARVLLRQARAELHARLEEELHHNARAVPLEGLHASGEG